jgi:predicted kinase
MDRQPPQPPSGALNAAASEPLQPFWRGSAAGGDSRGTAQKRLLPADASWDHRDMSTAESPQCVIVSGMPGAGKSRVTALAAPLLPRAAQVKGDDVNQMIVSGQVWFLGTPRDEAMRQYELGKRNMCTLANNFIDYGFTVLMDTVVQDRAMLDLLLALMSPRPVRLVILAPGIEVCRRRNETRHPLERFDFDGYAVSTLT